MLDHISKLGSSFFPLSIALTVKEHTFHSISVGHSDSLSGCVGLHSFVQPDSNDKKSPFGLHLFLYSLVEIPEN